VCPKKGKQGTAGATGGAKPHTSATRINGRLYMMTEVDDDGGDYSDIITGTFLVNSVPASILFYTGASLSHVSPVFVSKASLVDPVKVATNIALPNGQTLSCSVRYSDVPITILGSIFPANLLRLKLSDLDIVLGMDWLSKYHARFECRDQKITLEPRSISQQEVSYQGVLVNRKFKMVSVMRILELGRKGKHIYLLTS